jgi:uncharacterized protein YjfI (DUF2170 family)
MPNNKEESFIIIMKNPKQMPIIILNKPKQMPIKIIMKNPKQVHNNNEEPKANAL